MCLYVKNKQIVYKFSGNASYSNDDNYYLRHKRRYMPSYSIHNIMEIVNVHGGGEIYNYESFVIFNVNEIRQTHEEESKNLSIDEIKDEIQELNTIEEIKSFVANICAEKSTYHNDLESIVNECNNNKADTIFFLYTP